MAELSGDSVKVVVRVRPRISREEEEEELVHAITAVKQIQCGDANKAFTFDEVFPPDTQQQTIYEKVMRNLVDSLFNGYNVTVLAYGQTGSGKTFTMGSSNPNGVRAEEYGVIPRFAQDLFDRLKNLRDTVPGFQYAVKVSFIEIYGEDIRDLLHPDAESGLMIREEATGVVSVLNITETPINNAYMFGDCLQRGSLSRVTASTEMNLVSSRSHAIFTVTLEQQIPVSASADGEDAAAETKESNLENAATEKRVAKFHFVDLAGSERAKRTKAEGQRFKEGVSINLGLLALGNVISALCDKKKGQHVPYRSSKLTHLLKDSLGGNSKTLMIACVSPADKSLEETLSTLKYANRAKNIKNMPVQNRDINASQVAALKAELAKYKALLGVGSGFSIEEYRNMRDKYQFLDAEYQRQNEKNKELRRVLDQVQQDNVQLQAKYASLKVQYEQDTGRPHVDLVETAPGHASQFEGFIKRIQDLENELRGVRDELKQSQLLIEQNGLAGVDPLVDDALLELDMDNDDDELDSDIRRVSLGTHASPLMMPIRSRLTSKGNSPMVPRNLAAMVVEDVDSDDETAGAGSMPANEAEAAAIQEQQQALHSAKTRYVEEQGAMRQQVEALSEEIVLKESHVKAVKRKFHRMRAVYERRIEAMQKQMSEAEAEASRLREELGKLGSATGDAEKAAKSALERQLQDTEKKLRDLNQQHRGFDQLRRSQTQAQKQLQTLERELEGLKRQRVDTMRRAEQEKKRFEEERAQLKNQLNTLQRTHTRDQMELKKVQDMDRRREAAMQRRIEGKDAQIKRLQEVFMRNASIKKTAARVTQMTSQVPKFRVPLSVSQRAATRNKAVYDAVKQEAAVAVNKEREIADLKKALESREREIENMNMLLAEQRALVQQMQVPDVVQLGDDVVADIDSYFATAEGALHTTDLESKSGEAAAAGPVAAPRAILPEEAEALKEIEERIESAEARLLVTQSRIQEHLAASNAQLVDDSAHSTFAANARTLDEARATIDTMFGVIVELRASIMEAEVSRRSAESNLQTDLQQARQQIADLTGALQASQDKYLRTVVAMETRAEAEQNALLAVAADIPAAEQARMRELETVNEALVKEQHALKESLGQTLKKLHNLEAAIVKADIQLEGFTVSAKLKAKRRRHSAEDVTLLVAGAELLGQTSDTEGNASDGQSDDDHGPEALAADQKKPPRKSSRNAASCATPKASRAASLPSANSLFAAPSAGASAGAVAAGGSGITEDDTEMFVSGEEIQAALASNPAAVFGRLSSFAGFTESARARLAQAASDRAAKQLPASTHTASTPVLPPHPQSAPSSGNSTPVPAAGSSLYRATNQAGTMVRKVDKPVVDSKSGKSAPARQPGPGITAAPSRIPAAAAAPAGKQKPPLGTSQARSGAAAPEAPKHAWTEESVRPQSPERGVSPANADTASTSPSRMAETSVPADTAERRHSAPEVDALGVRRLLDSVQHSLKAPPQGLDGGSSRSSEMKTDTPDATVPATASMETVVPPGTASMPPKLQVGSQGTTTRSKAAGKTRGSLEKSESSKENNHA